MAVAAIPYILAAAAAMSAISQVQQGNAQKSLANYNATVADQQATSTRQWAAYNADRQADKARRLNANAEANFAANGMETEGSPLVVLADNAAQAEMDNLAIRGQGEAQASYYNAQAAGMRFQGSLAQRAGYIGAGTTLLQAGASMYAGGAFGGGASAGYGQTAGMTSGMSTGNMGTSAMSSGLETTF